MMEGHIIQVLAGFKESAQHCRKDRQISHHSGSYHSIWVGCCAPSLQTSTCWRLQTQDPYQVLKAERCCFSENKIWTTVQGYFTL